MGFGFAKETKSPKMVSETEAARLEGEKKESQKGNERKRAKRSDYFNFNGENVQWEQ